MVEYGVKTAYFGSHSGSQNLRPVLTLLFWLWESWLVLDQILVMRCGERKKSGTLKLGVIVEVISIIERLNNPIQEMVIQTGECKFLAMTYKWSIRVWMR